MANAPARDDALPTHLSVWDAVSIIVGIVIGAGIFETPPKVMSALPGPVSVLLVWIGAGLLCLVGALCYAELATTYPRAGGDYVYLTRAYGRWLGFLFGWAQVAVILTTNIGMVTYVFADYADRLFLGPKQGEPYPLGWLWAGSAVVVLTALNILGIRAGKLTQNLLTTIKVVGLSAIVVVGLTWPAPSVREPLSMSEGGNPQNLLAGALVLAFFTYGGWSDAAYVAAEVKNGRRNIPRALFLGTGFIILIYVLVNLAYLNSLGFAAARQSKAIAAEMLAAPFPGWGDRLMCLLVMVSALGTANGLLLTASRVALALGRDHALFAWLGHWHARRGSPYIALLTLGGISLGMILLVGTQPGQALLGWLFARANLEEVNWAGLNGFEALLRCTAPLFWMFFLLTGISLFILRQQQRHSLKPIERPFSVPFYPLVPLLFCATCAYLLYSGLIYAGSLGSVGAVLVLIGFPLYVISEWMTRRRSAGDLSVLTADATINHQTPSGAIAPDVRSLTRRETP